MAASQTNPAPAITLEQLIALNQEIAALVRAGVPLEGGLAQLGTDIPGRLGRITRMLAERMERGESLQAVLADQAQGFPPVYRAVVEAGLRSGRLPVALEGMAGAARRLADTRRAVATAFVYPLIVLLVAWGLFILFTVRVAPSAAPFLGETGAPLGGQLTALAAWGRSAATWGPILPAAAAVLGIAWWLVSSRPALLQSRWSTAALGWLPWAGPMLRSLRAAALAEVLALLVEHGVPLAEALRLAGRASGDPRAVRATGELAVAVDLGQPLPSAVSGRAEFPPLLRWLMTGGADRGTLVPALEHAAQTYRRRAERRAETIRVVLPLALTVAIGGTVTCLYALTVFAPWALLIRHLAGA